MENPTQFDLNEAVRNWREGLSGSPAIRAENLLELETHLRDGVAALEAAGLTPAEAFLVAQRRLGPASALDQEFGKVNRREVWLDRAVWMVAGSVVLTVLSSFVSMVNGLVSAAALHQALPGQAVGLLSVVVQWGVLCGLVAWLWRSALRQGGLHRMGHWLRDHPLPTALVVAGLLVTGYTGRTLAQMVLAKSAAVESQGILCLWHAAASTVSTLLVWPCLLGWLLARTARGRRQLAGS